MIVLLLPAVFVVLWLLALSIGNGRCGDCGRLCAPWSVFCSRHDPYGGAQ